MTGFQSSWIPNQQQFRHNPRSIVVYSLQTHRIMTSVYWRFSGLYPVLKINVSAHINWHTVFHVTYAFNMSLNHGKTSSHWWHRVTLTWRRWSPCTRRCLLRIFMLIDMGIFMCVAGCAFITFSSKQCAMNAIKAMHHSQTMEVTCCICCCIAPPPSNLFVPLDRLILQRFKV